MAETSLRSGDPRSILLIGSGNCVWDDIRNAESLAPFHGIAAVNEAGIYFPGPLDFWATLHPEKFEGWQALRKEYGFKPSTLHVSTENPTESPYRPRIDLVVDYRYPGTDASGSSGLYAVKIAQELGYNRIVLAGIPMSIEHKHFNNMLPWYERDSFIATWHHVLPLIKDQVRSLSGWTKELLGSPTKEWLNGSS